MGYKLNSSVEVILSEATISLQAPIWYLADWSLQLGEYKNGEELERLALASAGSYGWYGDGVDTILFSKPFLNLHTVVLKIPEAIQVIDIIDFQSDNCLWLEGNLTLCQSVNFRMEYCDITIYSKSNDNLFILMSSNLSELHYDTAIAIRHNMYILFFDGRYVGWLIKNASSFIPNNHEESETSKLDNDLIKKNLIIYMSYFSNEAKNRLEEEDPLMREELLKFQADMTTTGANKHLHEIQHGVSNLLDSYF